MSCPVRQATAALGRQENGAPVNSRTRVGARSGSFLTQAVRAGIGSMRCLENQEPLMMAKTVCFSLLAASLLAAAKPAFAGPLDEFRKDFAKAVYAGSPDLVHDRNPQPLLRAVIVLNVKMADDGHFVADVLRTNDEQPEMLARALETVQRAQVDAVPEPVRQELSRNGFVEAWLFDSDGTFQVKTLAKPQRSGT